MRVYTFCVWQYHGRLDQFLVSVYPQLSRAYIQAMIADEHVYVAGKIGKAGMRLHPQQELLIEIPQVKDVGILPADIPLEILYEDTDILVINKQAGLVMHPTDHGGHMSDTLVNALLFHRPQDFSIKADRRPGIVHRLDQDTSGIVVVAKNDLAHQRLAAQWQARSVVKIYQVLVQGRLKPEKGAIEAPLGRSLQDRQKMDIRPDEGGRYALTRYHVRQQFADCCLVEATIETGRTHQIRVHFASIGHPVVGDEVYGNHSMNKTFAQEWNLHRQFLHAARLEFTHPSNRERMVITSDLPKDLQTVLQGITQA